MPPTYTLSTNLKYQDKTGSAKGFKMVSFSTPDELANIAKKDWSPCVFTDGNRKKDNFEFSQWLYADVDEGCSIEQFGEKFNDYEYFLLTSRSHQKAKLATATKPGSPAQDRFHVLFPLRDVCYDSVALDQKLGELTGNNSFLDPSVKDSARFFFGFTEVRVFHHPGESRFNCADNSFIEFPAEPLREVKEKQVLDSLILAGQQGYLDVYADWLVVGTALKNEGYAFDDWVKVSKAGVNTGEMQSKWNGFDKSVTTGGTLVHFARMANPGLLKSGQGLREAVMVSHLDRPKTEIQKNIEKINSKIESSLMAQKFELTQFGTRDRVIYYHGNVVRYVRDRQDWFLWNGSRWQEEASNKVSALISETIEKIKDREKGFYPFARADKNSSQEEQIAAELYKSFNSYVKTSQTASHVEGAEKLMRSVHNIVTEDNQYDRDPMLFNCENGMVDLNTGELLPHDPDSLCSKIATIHYDKSAKAPKWVKMMSDVMCGRVALVNWLQEYFGYCLTGLPPDRVLAIFWGSGANGKSSVINILRHILGSYSVVSRPETFMQSDNMDKIGQDLVNLRGARNIIMQETSEGQKLDVQRIKAFTGKDAIKGRYLFSRNEITFVNTGKIILATNHKPRISGDDKAMWDRVKLIPFERVFTESERDNDLPDRIIAEETSGVLNWMIEGCLRLKARGWKFQEVSEITSASEEYRREEDKMSQFIEENCTFSGESWVGATPEVQPNLIYGRYKEWCDEVGIKPVALVRFFKEISQGRPWIQKYRTAKTWVYQGIRLRNEEEEFVSHEDAMKKTDDGSDAPF